MALFRSEETGVWTVSMLEWGILAGVIAIIMGVFMHYAYRVQGQAERAAVMTSLGSLRTALVINHLSVQSASASLRSEQVPANPFDVLQALPENYRGLVKDGDLSQIAPGSWVFDVVCNCIGYKPQHPEWLETPPNAEALWFLLISEGGVRQLKPMSAYTWQGLSIN